MSIRTEKIFLRWRNAFEKMLQVGTERMFAGHLLCALIFALIERIGHNLFCKIKVLQVYHALSKLL